MPVVFGEKRRDGKLVVTQIQYQIKSHPNGYSVKKVPDYPEPKVGILPVMIFDPKTKRFSFEEKKRPLTRDEIIDLGFKNILEKMDKIISLLQKKK